VQLRSKEGGRGQDKRGGQKAEACGRGRKKKIDGVPSITLEQSIGGRCCPFRRY